MSRTVHEVRAHAAGAAFRALGPSPNLHRVLAVHCARGHHVAGVFRTPEGPVCVTRPRAHAHGDRDRHDAAHHGGHRDTDLVDWLEPGVPPEVDDAVPAGCECGPRSLSRTALRAAVAAGEHRLVVD